MPAAFTEDSPTRWSRPPQAGQQPVSAAVRDCDHSVAFQGPYGTKRGFHGIVAAGHT